jgi:hypothetical protein
VSQRRAGLTEGAAICAETNASRRHGGRVGAAENLGEGVFEVGKHPKVCTSTQPRKALESSPINDTSAYNHCPHI